MSGSATRWSSDDRGATAVEFAIVLPVFLTLMFGVFQFGWAQHRLSSVRHALETASRRLVIDPSLTEAQITQIVQGELALTADPNVTVDLELTPVPGGRLAEITGRYVGNIGIPGLATYPLNWSTSVSAALVS